MNPDRRFGVERLAELARLEVEPSEIASLTRDIAAIIEYVSQIGGVGPAQVSHSSSDELSEAAAPLREDEPDSTASVENPCTFAPDFENGFFVVPRTASMGEG